MNSRTVKDMQAAAAQGRAVTPDTALDVLRAGVGEWPEVMAAASALRTRYFGNRVNLCTILNARSGACSEDCAFCAQSAHHNTSVPTYSLKRAAEIGAAYAGAAKLPASHFGIVTSGETLDDEGVEEVCRAVRSGQTGRMAWCASLGGLTGTQLRALKAAGVQRFHHNLETAPSFFPAICTTHTYADRLRTMRAVKATGLEVCSGGILGMGESVEQRVEFAVTLAAEQVDSIPLNFLMPIAGTRLGHLRAMEPLDILKSVAMFRLVNPRAEIKVCAGRIHLRDLQSMIFFAGATGMMIGPLLTVPNRDEAQDLQMLADLGLDIARGGWTKG
jgi:biotin synthase